MDATRLYLADCVGVIVLPISCIIIASTYKELKAFSRIICFNVHSIHLGIFHTTKMNCILSNKKDCSPHCTLYRLKIAFQHGGVTGHLNELFLCA